MRINVLSLDEVDICISSSNDDAARRFHSNTASDVEGGTKADKDEGVGDGELIVSDDGHRSFDGEGSSKRLWNDTITVSAGGIGVLRRSISAVVEATREGTGCGAVRGLPSGLATAASRSTEGDSLILKEAIAQKKKKKKKKKKKGGSVLLN